MAVRLPNNVKLYLASTYVAADTVSAITNANPGVITTSASHGISTGGYFELSSGWQLANERVFRAASASGSTLSIEGLDTTSTTDFPVGTGTGTLREISAWTQILQVTDFSTSGGEPQYVQYEFLEENFQRQLPNGSSAQSITFSIGDDPSLAGYVALKAASSTGALTALRMQFASGSQLIFNGYAFLNETPSMQKGSVMTCSASFSLSGKPVRYSS